MVTLLGWRHRLHHNRVRPPSVQRPSLIQYTSTPSHLHLLYTCNTFPYIRHRILFFWKVRYFPLSFFLLSKPKSLTLLLSFLLSKPKSLTLLLSFFLSDNHHCAWNPYAGFELKTGTFEQTGAIYLLTFETPSHSTTGCQSTTH